MDFIVLKIMLSIFRVYFLVSITCVAVAQDVKLMKSAMSTSASAVSDLVRGTISVNYTIGQSAGVDHLKAGQIHLLQGFQHPYLSNCNNCTDINTSIFIYPNPSQGLITIRWNEAIDEWVWLDVVDVHGKFILKIILERKGQELQFNASSLPKATYIIQLRGEISGFATHKLILI